MANTVVVSEGVERTSGRDAQRSNIMVICALADNVRTTLGPKGMDKLIVDGLGDIVVTNDGYTLLTEMRINHPAAKLAIEAVIAQQDRVGDGTTTVMVLAGELLRKALELLELDIHPAVVSRGYRIAERMAQEILEGLAETIPLSDSPELRRALEAVAHTAMTGKGAESAKGTLTDLAIQSIRHVVRQENGRTVLDRDSVKIERMVASSSAQSELVKGVVLMRERAHPHMPLTVKGAKVALIDQPIEIKSPEITAQIQISEPGQMQAFIDQERRTLAAMVERIAHTGCNVLLCQQNIEEPAEHFLAKAGIFAVRRVPQSDLIRVAKATGANIVSSPSVLEASDLGSAGRVRQEVKGSSSLVFIEECENPKAVTLLLKGGTQHAAEEVRRAVEDAMGDIGSVLGSGKLVAGAGAVEVQVSRLLREQARKALVGKERLVVNAFADAMLVIPRTLVESSGCDPIDTLADIEARQERGERWTGFDVLEGTVVDCWKRAILEPLEIKTQAIGSATEVAVMILRIDDMFIGHAGQEK